MVGRLYSTDFRQDIGDGSSFQGRNPMDSTATSLLSVLLPASRRVRRRPRMPGVSLRRWRSNRGFAQAVNEGVRLSRGDWVLLLNPDMSLEPGFLDKALARAEELAKTDADTGIIGFGLRDADGGRQRSAGPFPTLAS